MNWASGAALITAAAGLAMAALAMYKQRADARHAAAEERTEDRKVSLAEVTLLFDRQDKEITRLAARVAECETARAALRLELEAMRVRVAAMGGA